MVNSLWEKRICCFLLDSSYAEDINKFIFKNLFVDNKSVCLTPLLYH